MLYTVYFQPALEVFEACFFTSKAQGGRAQIHTETALVTK